MKIYLINLDKDKERLVAAGEQLRKFGLKFERISAVYGRELPQKELDKAVDHFRWWCAVGRPCRPGEIGCALSHYSIYKRIANNKSQDPVCVLEDDVLLDCHFRDVLDFVGDNIDLSKAQVVLLSNHCKKVALSSPPHSSDFPRIEKCHSDLCAEGYVITPLAARALLKANLPLQCPCDWWGRWHRHGIIELFHAFPTVCSQERIKYLSSISGNKGFVVSELPLHKYMAHKCKRIVGILMDKTLSMLHL